jgi:hypothetical protein
MTAPAPVGTIHVVDPSPLNWLYITWNTMEEPIRMDEDGAPSSRSPSPPTGPTSARWS